MDKRDRERERERERGGFRELPDKTLLNNFYTESFSIWMAVKMYHMPQKLLLVNILIHIFFYYLLLSSRLGRNSDQIMDTSQLKLPS